MSFFHSVCVCVCIRLSVCVCACVLLWLLQAFQSGLLNEFMSLGKPVWKEARQVIQDLLSKDHVCRVIYWLKSLLPGIMAASTCGYSVFVVEKYFG